MMAHEVTLIQRQAQLTLAIRKRSPGQDLPQVIPETIRAIKTYLAHIGHQPSGEPFVAYYNLDMHDLDVDIGFFSAEPVPGNETIHPGMIPGGKAASCLHIGSYATIFEAHETLHHWLEQQGYKSVNGFYEVYLNDPADTPENALRTEVFTLLNLD